MAEEPKPSGDKTQKVRVFQGRSESGRFYIQLSPKEKLEEGCSLVGDFDVPTSQLGALKRIVLENIREEEPEAVEGEETEGGEAGEEGEGEEDEGEEGEGEEGEGEEGEGAEKKKAKEKGSINQVRIAILRLLG